MNEWNSVTLRDENFRKYEKLDAETVTDVRKIKCMNYLEGNPCISLKKTWLWGKGNFKNFRLGNSMNMNLR